MDRSGERACRDAVIFPRGLRTYVDKLISRVETDVFNFKFRSGKELSEEVSDVLGVQFVVYINVEGADGALFDIDDALIVKELAVEFEINVQRVDGNV